MKDKTPVAPVFPYTHSTAQLNKSKRNCPATKAQSLSLKALVDRLFPCNHPDNQSATAREAGCNSANKKQEKRCTPYNQLEKRIIVMAKRWDYTPEELKWALSQSKIKPREWSLVCTDDEKPTRIQRNRKCNNTNNGPLSGVYSTRSIL